MESRINYLDGLRGVAILLVISFHAYSRWTDILPYGDTYQNFPIFKFGWLGVELFFLISGFVIFMTLDKTINFKIFIYKRYLRLFPVMLLVSILLYLSTPIILSERPIANPDFLSLIPGLTFIEPYYWNKLLGENINILEGSFWSLYVEFKFYILAGLIYFILGRKYLAPSLFGLFIISLVVSFLSGKIDSQLIIVVEKFSTILSLKYFGWFSSGSIFYLYSQTKKEYYFIIATSIAILSSFFMGDIYVFIAASIISGLFAISLKVNFIQRILRNNFFLFFGLISYPLYLLHENSMISIIIQLQDSLPWLNMFFYPFIPIIILSLISYLIVTQYEKKIITMIKKRSRKL